MKPIRFAFLSAADMPALHQTFLEAFADYIIPIQLSEDQFKLKIKREGIVPDFCVAAYYENKMVGFILTGLGEWQGQPTAFNAGTGVVPAYRGQRLTQQLYAFLLPKLRESGVECCLLEVIQENAPAFKSYKQVGMHVTRNLYCFRAKKEDLVLRAEPPVGISLLNVTKYDWEAYCRLCMFEPAWQNTIAAVKRSISDCAVLEARDDSQQLCGYIMFYPKTGAVAQLAVEPGNRNRGIGTALLKEAAKQTSAPAMLFINIEDTASQFLGYLQSLNFSRFLQQYEMLMKIV